MDDPPPGVLIAPTSESAAPAAAKALGCSGAEEDEGS